MRWLILFLGISVLLPALGRGPRPRVRLVSWNVSGLLDGDEPPWVAEDRLAQAIRALSPLKAELAGLLEVHKPERLERLAARAGFRLALGGCGVGLLSRLPIRGYRTFLAGERRVLEVHFDTPWPFAVLLAQAEQPHDSWRVATRVWELQTRCPGRGLAVLGDLGPEAPWLREVGLGCAVPGIWLDPLLSRRVQIKSCKIDQRKFVQAASPHRLVRLELR